MRHTTEVIDAMKKSNSQQVKDVARILETIQPGCVNDVAEDLLGWILALHQAEEPKND